MANDSKPNEFDLIERFFAPLAGKEGLGLQDDAALLTPPADKDLVISKDLLVAGTHFFPTDDPKDVAFKAVSVNVSDLAAKGAAPLGYLVGLVVPKCETAEWFQSFSSGLERAQELYGLKLLGGDTTSGEGPLVVSVTVIGHVSHGTMVKRSGARVGDSVYVTGTVGDAALGLAAIEGRCENHAVFEERFRRPTARNTLATLIKSFATASADVSDGLLADIGHICQSSSVGVRLHQAYIPLSPAATSALKDSPKLWPSVLSGGDDYELVFTAPIEAKDKIKELANQTGISVSSIGVVTSSNSVELIDLNGKLMQVEASGYTHF